MPTEIWIIIALAVITGILLVLEIGLVVKIARYRRRTVKLHRHPGPGQDRMTAESETHFADAVRAAREGRPDADLKRLD